MAKKQRQIDREAEEKRQKAVEIAVADRNTQIVKGADPDPNVGTGFYPDLYPGADSKETPKGKGK